MISYNSPIIKYFFNMSYIECTNSKKHYWFEWCHIELLWSIVFNFLIMSSFPNHWHFGFCLKMTSLVKNSCYGVSKTDHFFKFHPRCFCHLFIFTFQYLLIFLILIVSGMNCKRNWFWINSIFHIAKDKTVLPLYCSVKSKDTFFLASAAINDFVVWIKDEKVYLSRFFACSGRCICKISTANDHRKKIGCSGASSWIEVSSPGSTISWSMSSGTKSFICISHSAVIAEYSWVDWS